MTEKRGFAALTALIAGLLIVGFAAVASASGFAIYTQGAESLGQAAATVAHTDDPSAVFYNPALINKLNSAQVMLGTTIIFPSRKFTSSLTGLTTTGEDNDQFPSTFYATYKLNDQISFGLGVFNPFGLKTEWPTYWEGRYIATTSELTTYNVNPVVSYQVAPWLSLAAGVDFIYGDAKLGKQINLSSLGLPDGSQQFKGNGTGWGYNIGLLLEPVKDVAIGVQYRSLVKMRLDGDATFVMPVVSPALASLFPNTSGSAGLTLPQQVFLGVNYNGLYPFTFEVGARWEGWSSFKNVTIGLDQAVAGSMFSFTPRNWKDTWTGNIGVKYHITESLAILGGFLYQGNPVPDSTFDPSIPDANGYLVSIGIDYKCKSLRVGLAYAYQWLQDRTKFNTIDDNPFDGVVNPQTSANGVYKSNLNMVGISLTYMF